MQKALGTIVAVIYFQSFSPAFAAVPVISNVSGNIAAGQTLTITGANMVDENNANWDTFFKTGSRYGFEGSSPAADFLCDLGPCSGTYTTANRLMGDKSILFHTQGAHTANLGEYVAAALTSLNTAGDIWYRWYTQWHSAGGLWVDSHIKHFYPGGGTGTSPFIQPDMGDYPDYSYPRNIEFGHMDYMDAVPFPEGRLTPDRWYCIEAQLRNSDRHLVLFIDGAQVGDAVSPEVFQQQYFRIGIINECCNSSSSWSLDNYWDGFTASSTRIYPASKIEIGNNSSYANGTKVYQIPLYLSDGSVQVKVNLTGLGPGPYYLWVTNNRQEVSAAYPLSGGSPDTQAPTVSLTAPANGATVSALVTVSAAASDNVGVSGVQFKLDGSNLGSEDTALPHGISWNTTDASNGAHSLAAVARDAAGNTATSNTVSVTVSNQADPPPAGDLLIEPFDNSNWSGKGWYDNTNHGIIDTATKYAGASSLRYDWTAGSVKPTNGDTTRHLFTPTDSLYVSVYIRLGTGWVGSGQAYHPHLIYFLSDLDGDYDGMAWSYLDTYMEVNGAYPSIQLQDGKNINYSYGSLPNNLVATTENRAVAGCNGCLGDCGTESQSCYDAGGGTYWNGAGWRSATALSLNVWHHYEAYFKMNTISGGKAQADGMMQVWLDGSQVINKTNIVYRTNQHPTMKWKQIDLGPYIGDGSPKAQSMWWDELKLSTARPGSDGTPPSMPGGLKVR